MFTNKYNEAMKFLDEEIACAAELFEQYLSLADVQTKNGKDNTSEFEQAREWSSRLSALRELRLRLISKVGSYKK